MFESTKGRDSRNHKHQSSDPARPIISLQQPGTHLPTGLSPPSSRAGGGPWHPRRTTTRISPASQPSIISTNVQSHAKSLPALIAVKAVRTWPWSSRRLSRNARTSWLANVQGETGWETHSWMITQSNAENFSSLSSPTWILGNHRSFSFPLSSMTVWQENHALSFTTAQWRPLELVLLVISLDRANATARERLA